MKKEIILIFFILINPVICDCQWYQRYFGVNDPYLLSNEQVNMALKKSKEGIVTGTTLTIIGSFGILSGTFLFLKDYPDDKYPDQAEMGKKFEGALLALVSLTPEIIGISLLKKNKLRHLEIERFLNSTKTNFGISIHTSKYFLNEPTFDFIPGISLTFRF